jgi:hypothetical protein
LNHRILAWAIALVALADGLLHFTLDFVFFRGNFFRNDLSTLFLLNFIGYVALAAAVLFGHRWLGQRAWLPDAAVLVYALVSIGVWVQRGSPAAGGWGYPSKALEVVLILLVLAHWTMSRQAVEAPVGSRSG